MVHIIDTLIDLNHILIKSWEVSDVDAQYVLAVACMLLLFGMYLIILSSVYKSFDTLKQLTRHKGFLFRLVLASFPFIIMAMVDLSLPFFYLFIYIACNCTIQYLYQEPHGKWLLGNLHYIAFISTHLIVVGIIALSTDYDILGVLASGVLRSYSICIVLVINIFITLSFRHMIKRGLIQLKDLEAEEFQLFSKFISFCAIFVLLDSIPCTYDISERLSSLFLIGSNFLLAMMIVIFARYAYSLLHNAHVKKQYIDLKLAESKQRTQTKQWEQRAYIDALTGAYTRRYVMNNLATMLHNKETFALVFIDLDGLKQVNDDAGHIAGDQVLKQFSSYMKSCLRPKDIFARYGGDEFLVLMPEYSLEEAKASLLVCRSQARACSFSYGVVSGKDSDLQPDELIALADHEMYEDKQRTKKAGVQS